MLRAALAVAALVAVPSAALAQAQAKPAWYVGAGIGYSKLTERVNADTSVVIPGATSSDFRSKTADTSGKLFAGFNLNRHLAIEAAYLQLGKYYVRRQAFAPTSGSLDLAWQVRGFSIAAKPQIALSPAFSVYGKLGVARLQTEVDQTGSVLAASVNQSSNRWSLFYGIGAEYDVTRNFGVRAEWEYYRHATNTNTLSFGDGKPLDYNTFFASGYLRF